jgi:RNA polymerase sigma-70 factor (ECF subfamily)
METQTIWHNYNSEMYFFILKKVKDKNAADDILQNTFLKIHKSLPQLKDSSRVRAWVFQIARNEIINYFTYNPLHLQTADDRQDISDRYQPVCCFNKFINELPDKYKQVIELVYFKGEKQKDAAAALEISLENVKARIKRAKDMLRKSLADCCKYQFDKRGNLTGEPNCRVCEQ